MQDEIVARVASALNAPLMAAEAQKAERSADLYFQGMAWVNKGLRPDWLDQARSCFEKAKAIDDTNLEALVGIGMVDTLRGVACAGDNPAGALESARACWPTLYRCARPCVGALSDGCGPHFHPAGRTRHNGMRANARPQCDFGKRARNARTGKISPWPGRGNRESVEEALRLSPLDTFAYLWMLFAGVAKIQAEDYDKAVEWAEAQYRHQS